MWSLYPPTIILRHRRENLKKCSLRGLEERADFCFFRYPCAELPALDRPYLILKLGAPVLQPSDANSGLFLLDATWRYADKMDRFVASALDLPQRSIPVGFRTAYPRRQEDCPDPNCGLASIEALYIAYRLLGRETAGLLDRYPWREQFLQCNDALFTEMAVD